MKKLKVISFIFLIGAITFQACTTRNLKFPQAEISKLDEIDVQVHRYGKTLFELDTNNFKEGLKSIYHEYNFFLEGDLDDSANVQKLYNYVSDTRLVSIYKETIEVFPTTDELEVEIAGGFSRFHYFFPEISIPKVYTYISDMYYEVPVWRKDSALIIALDIYLGKDFPLYRQLGLPMFRIRNMAPEYLTVDVMKAMYQEELSIDYKRKTLLDRMIDEGKILVYLDAVLPDIHDSIKIRFTGNQLNWAIENEKNVWAFLVGNELLYATDYHMQTKLMQDGPFTEGFGNDSPSRLGAFIGWQIVTDYLVKNPGLSLRQLFDETDAQLILQKSR